MGWKGTGGLDEEMDGIGSGSAHQVSRSLSPRDITELYHTYVTVPTFVNT